MDEQARAPITRTRRIALLAVALPLVGVAGAWAAVQYLDDGAVQNPASGGWNYPQQGSCPVDPAQPTRPDCLALRLTAYTTQADCTNAATGGANRSWSTGVCNDLVNNADQATCEAVEDRKWSNGICSVVMFGDDRNNVVCALHGGTWVTSGTCVGNWVMPPRTAYTPPLLSSNGTGDQCLRCHNAGTQYNGPRVRDTENFLYSGHANMARKVEINKPWGGPPFTCTSALYTDEQTCEANGFEWHPTIYPSDDTGNPIDWINGTITVSGVARDLAWIYGDWLAPLPRAVYKAPASASRTCSIPLPGACSNPVYVTQGDCTANGGTWTSNSSQAGCEANGGAWLLNAGVGYTCGRCHTTGWTSDATVNLAREPEKSFPGITWDRLSDAGFGVVNTAGGVTGDPNKSSSWDTWGITCSRCHTSVVDTNNVVAGSDPPEYNAPTGMSRHHSNLTTFDIGSGSGVCSDSRFTAQAQCDAAGGAWLTACSLAGVCSNPAHTTSGTCTLNAGVWTRYDTQALCTGAGATWYTSSCNVAGVCNTLDPAHSTQALCTTAGGQWAAATDVVRCLDIHEFGKEHGIPEWEAARWTGSKPNRGPIITRLCMDCHRQETGGMPYANATATPGTLDTVNPGRHLKVGPAHGTVSFVSHPHGNQFLNSPHGKFSGTFSQIATGTFNFAMTGLYKSFFQIDGEAANTGNGCTGCHDVHESVVPETSPFPAIREECTECHAKSLGLVLHPAGPGTPLENMATHPVEACETCHMPERQHLWRVKADPDYATLPNSAMTATVNANTSPDGNFAEAVWVDMDHACGQCHGGGTVQASTTGSITANTKVLTVADATGFAANQRVRIGGAGSLTYDDEGAVINGDFDTYIVSVGSGVLNLAGNATKTVTGESVVQNPTRNGAGYLTRAELATLAQGIHNDKPSVNFGYTIGSPNTLMVNVDASGATCRGSSGNCDAYEWDWGDGSPAGSGMVTSHTYATPGAKSITLTVEEFGVGGASATRTVNVSTPDFPPTADGLCAFDANTWIETLTDASTDDNGIKQITVTWGDGSVLFSDTTAPFGPASHTYLNVGSYTISHKAIDTIGQQNIRTCLVSPAYFTISGTVYRPGGTQPLAGAIVTAKKGALVVGSAYSASDGSFTVGNLKPGAYTLTVVRSGYTFSVPAASLSVGPSSAGNDITALTGLLTAPKQLSKDRRNPRHGKGAASDDPVVAPAP